VPANEKPGHFRARADSLGLFRLSAEHRRKRRDSQDDLFIKLLDIVLDRPDVGALDPLWSSGYGVLGAIPFSPPRHQEHQVTPRRKIPHTMKQ
jgi:hypothetical protein